MHTCVTYVTYTHIYIYIYMYVCIRMCVPLCGFADPPPIFEPFLRVAASQTCAASSEDTAHLACRKVQVLKLQLQVGHGSHSKQCFIMIYSGIVVDE